jgi:uncharacterized membrane protein YfcA
VAYELHDFLGNVGVVLILLSYLLLQIEKMSATSLLYSLVNAIGAVLILISLMYDFNLSAFIVEVVWLLISVYALTRRGLKRRPATGG